MRDLDIWRRLVADSATVPEMETDLLALAALPIGRRVAFVGAVLPYASHNESAIRAAALRALAGTRGIEGVRAIVARLDDPNDDVRIAALAALREIARDAPHRYVHALFHARPEIRRAALEGELSSAVGELAIYLRADPECVELAAKLRWPDNSLGLALELHAAGHVRSTELVHLLLHTSAKDVRQYLRSEHQRSNEVVDAYLEHASHHGLTRAPGSDILDTMVAAIGAIDTLAVADRTIDHLIDVITPNNQRALGRRAAVALLSFLADPAAAISVDVRQALLAACVAVEPRVLGYRGLATADLPSLAAAATRGLFRFRWPVRPSIAQIERLLALPLVRDDLALAAAVAGLLPAMRLKGLDDALGEDAIIAALLASDHGWDEVCRLPREMPALELAWLAAVEKADYKRYIALAGRVLGSFTGTRLEAFIEQIPRRHREGVFLAALAAHATASDERIATACRAIAARVDRMTLVVILQALIDRDEDGRRVLAFVRAVTDKLLGSAAVELTDDAAVRLVGLLDADPAPRDRELALARAWLPRKLAVVADWIARVESLLTASVLQPPPAMQAQRELTPAERDKIATCGDRDLEARLAPAFAGVVSGLCGALAARAVVPHVAACTALFGCADPLVDVARQLDRFSVATPAFEAKLDNDVGCYLRMAPLPPLAHARLWRWEAHGFGLVDWIEGAGGVHQALAYVDVLPGRLARHTMWKAISEAMMLLRYRSLERFRRHGTIELAQFAAERVDKDIGRHAARLVVALVEGGAVPVAAVRDRMLERIADADAETREYAARLVRLDGMPEPPMVVDLPPAPLLESIRACTDLDTLAAWCTDPRSTIVQEAALALVVLGSLGQARLAELLADLHKLAAPIPILATILLWDHPPALAAVRELGRAPGLPAAWQFHIQLSLVARGETDALPLALEAVRETPARWYFRRDDWDALVRVADAVTCSLALADAPHHHAYQRAIQILLSVTGRASPQPTDEVFDALRRFLEADADRPLHMRVAVARALAQHRGDSIGLPVLIEYIADERADDWPYTLELVPRIAMPRVAEAIVSAALVGGPNACSEKRMWAVVQRMRDHKFLTPEQSAEHDARILEHAASATARRSAGFYAVSDTLAHGRLRRVAEVFAWGVRRGVELSGRIFRIHMTSSERDLGHTRVDGSRIFVSPLPMLRAETHGQDVVEGLVLHEIGHHVYHRGEEAQKLWKQAHAEGIGHFLNLIADEHLERNLRAVDPSYGDRLKRLDAYAFQHAPQEIKVAVLVACLRGSTASALIAAELGVAFDESSVRMRRGAILGELDRRGHPVARFARALRMGLGNRSTDPLIGKALDLCGKQLRTLDMRGLYELTKQLVGMFGGAIRIASVFGGPEGLVFGERDDDVFGHGIGDDILQREVERILDPRQAKGGRPGGNSRLAINVNTEVKFPKITSFERVRGDQDVHRALALQVRRHSTRLRTYLDELGLRWDPMRARTQGRALDRTRLRALVTRGDPRILIARTPTRRTDLFLGTLVDCSGSMSAGDNITRAKRFAILVAEAVRNLPGVNARFFGFTDSVIYDAGDAEDCNVVALESNGGNNDAGALYYAANVALNAPQRAKVLVMISDGLPTECSTAALRGLVTELTKRRGIVCAQVAVRKLEEVCFPNYVVLDDREPDVAVAKFGRMIGDLARRSLSS